MKKISKTAIIASTDHGIRQGLILQKELTHSTLFSTRTHDLATPISSISDFLSERFSNYDAFVFIGALGICVRSIAPYLNDKYSDPAVVNMDDSAQFVQAVVSGHTGGANVLTRKIAAAFGAQAVITTSSDVQELWSLDLLATRFGWKYTCNQTLNQLISLFVNHTPTALLLDIRDEGTAYLSQTLPEFVTCFTAFEDIDFNQFGLFIAVTYKAYQVTIPSIQFYAPVLHAGLGCSRYIGTEELDTSVRELFHTHGFAFLALKSFGSATLKHDEVAFLNCAEQWQVPFVTFPAETLDSCAVVNPSEVVYDKLGTSSVSEASAMLLSGNTQLLLEKQKITVPSGKKHTLAIAIEPSAVRNAVIAIVGAGPGDADLISVRGKQLLCDADLVLYAGSLIPEELTHAAKPGAIVRNSAGMTLEEQIELMEQHYTRGHLIVRLQSGDPSIYGAIQEQMSVFDEKGMEYFIVPGISSFQAAAAVLQSEFTVPEVVQSIILTRGEGKTPLPEKEKLSEMARHQATMCIFLSATIARDVQEQLLTHYPPETPVAVLYRVTWKDEQVYTGELKDLARIIRDSKHTLTVLIIVGAAIGARKNRSHLYLPSYKHTFRTGKKVKVTQAIDSTEN